MIHNPSRSYKPFLRHLSSFMMTAVMALCALVLLPGCDDNDADLGEVNPAVQNLLQLDGEGNGSTRFLLYTPGATEPQVLTTTSQLQLPEDAFMGETYLVAYTAADINAPTTAISVRGLARITNANLQRGTQDDLEGWDSDPVWVTCLLYTSPSPRD